eukprot:749489-Amorphochlora_amoeboformis.AAC.2
MLSARISGKGGRVSSGMNCIMPASFKALSTPKPGIHSQNIYRSYQRHNMRYSTRYASRSKHSRRPKLETQAQHHGVTLLPRFGGGKGNMYPLAWQWLKRRAQFSTKCQEEQKTSTSTAADTGGDACGDGLGSGVSWQDIGVSSSELINNLIHAMAIQTPNQLQTRSTPFIKKGRDAILASYTGSGKTLAALVPLVDRMLTQRNQTNSNIDQRQVSHPSLNTNLEAIELEKELETVPSS